MSEAHDAGRSSSGSAEAEAARRLHQDPHGVVRFFIEGWPSDAGTADALHTALHVTPTKDGPIEWMRIEATRMRLYNNAHMYLIQGMPIAQLLMSMSVACGEHTLPGPLLYVTGHASEIWKVPFLYRGLILGRALHAPKSMTVSEILLALFNDEMKRRKA